MDSLVNLMDWLLDLLSTEWSPEEEANLPPDSPVNNYPTDGSTGIEINPELNVSASDPDGDTMNVSFYDASDDSLIGTVYDVPSDGHATYTWPGLDYETTYSWYAVADDGIDSTQSATWSFTTEEEP